jgi:hypothetical protein
VRLGATTTSITSSQNPVPVGQPVTFTATVSPATATGTVQFYIKDESTGTSSVTGQLLNGVATFTTSTLTAGPKVVSAQYGGDTRYATSQSPQITQDVKNPVTTNLTITPNPSTYGAIVTLAAHVTPATATGTMQFFNGTTLLSSQWVGGGIPCEFSLTTLAVGTSSITASYLGDARNFASVSSAVVVTITKADSTTTLSASPATPSFGQAVTLTALVTPPNTGTVQFFNGTTLLGTAPIANN